MSDAIKLVEDIRKKLEECDRLRKAIAEMAKYAGVDIADTKQLALKIFETIFAPRREEQPKYVEENEESSSSS